MPYSLKNYGCTGNSSCLPMSALTEEIYHIDCPDENVSIPLFHIHVLY